MAIPATIRDDFPILKQRVHGRPLVYLDSANTSQKPRVVIDALVRYYEEYNANIHRGVYAIAERATAEYEAARAKVARFLGAAEPAEIVFTRNITEALNLVAHSWGRRHVGPGDEILTTEMEHHSDLVPWQFLAQERGARLRHIPFDDEGRLVLGDLDRLLTARTKIVSLVHVSNTFGTVNPVAEIARRAHAYGAVVVVDGAQSAPHRPVDVQALGVDVFGFTGHKMLAPMGVGGLWARRALLEEMEPFLGGGEMISDVPGLRILGPAGAADRGGVISFAMDGVHPHDIAQVLDEDGVCVRAGHHCTKPLHRRLGIGSSVRASFYVYTTREEIDVLARSLLKVRSLFRVA